MSTNSDLWITFMLAAWTTSHPILHLVLVGRQLFRYIWDRYSGIYGASRVFIPPAIPGIGVTAGSYVRMAVKLGWIAGKQWKIIINCRMRVFHLNNLPLKLSLMAIIERERERERRFLPAVPDGPGNNNWRVTSPTAMMSILLRGKHDKIVGQNIGISEKHQKFTLSWYTEVISFKRLTNQKAGGKKSVSLSK